MLALPLRLPTAPYGGHMGHFLLSILALMGSTPLGNMASLSVELNSKYLVQDRPHKLYEDVIPLVPRSPEMLELFTDFFNYTELILRRASSDESLRIAPKP